MICSTLDCIRLVDIEVSWSFYTVALFVDEYYGMSKQCQQDTHDKGTLDHSCWKCNVLKIS